jgi:hypothetical protein
MMLLVTWGTVLTAVMVTIRRRGVLALGSPLPVLL